MSRNSPLYWAYLLTTIFACGFLIANMATTRNPSARLGFIGTMCLVLALTPIVTRRLRKSPPLHQLTASIRTRAQELIDSECVLLVPCDRDRPSTQKVLIGASARESELYIDRYGWDDTIRRYVVRSDGTVARRVLCRNSSAHISLSDRLWCFRPLTYARLKYLHKALSELYDARRRLQPVR